MHGHLLEEGYLLDFRDLHGSEGLDLVGLEEGESDGGGKTCLGGQAGVEAGDGVSGLLECQDGLDGGILLSLPTRFLKKMS